MIKLQEISRKFQMLSNEETFEIYFSYDIPIAFSIFGKKYICENVWTNWTGQHLNWIDGGGREAQKKRIERNDFLEAYKAFHQRILTAEFIR